MFNKKIEVKSLILVLFCLVVGFSCAPKPAQELVSLTKEELKNYNGKSGRPTYVAVNGNIYDISKCKYWSDGGHAKSKGKAFAGRDLTEVLGHSKHGIKRLKSYPIVGHLVEN